MVLAKRKMLAYKNTKAFMMMGSVVGFFSLLFFCSCTPKKAPRATPNITTVTQVTIPLRASFLEEAKQFDSLVPLGFRRIKKQVCRGYNSPMLLVRYEGAQSLSKVISFYQRELEASGWDLVNFSSEQEGLFFCRKGLQECAIAIRAKGTTIITFTYHTKAQNHQSNDFASINKPLKF